MLLIGELPKYLNTFQSLDYACKRLTGTIVHRQVKAGIFDIHTTCLIPTSLSISAVALRLRYKYPLACSKLPTEPGGSEGIISLRSSATVLVQILLHSFVHSIVERPPFQSIRDGESP